MAKTKKMTKTKERERKSTYVGIAGSIGGISLVIVIAIAIFASTQLVIAVPIVIALCVLGIFLGYFASKWEE